MSARWHHLESEKDTTSDGPEDDDRGRDPKEESEEEEEEEEEAHEEEGEESDEEAAGIGANRSTEHRIDMDSFWDDDEGDGDAGRLLRSLPPHLEDDHSIIDVLASEIRQQAIPSYLDQFEVVIPDAELLVGVVPLEDVQQREREIEEAAIRRKQLDVEMFRLRETRLLQREMPIRDELKREAERKHKELAQRKLQFAETIQLRMRRLTQIYVSPLVKE